MAIANEITRGGIQIVLQAAAAGSTDGSEKKMLCLQVSELKAAANGQRYRCRLSDLDSSIEAALPTAAVALIREGKLKDGSHLVIAEHTISEVKGQKVMVVITCEVSSASPSKTHDASPASAAAAVDGPSLKRVKIEGEEEGRKNSNAAEVPATAAAAAVKPVLEPELGGMTVVPKSAAQIMREENSATSSRVVGSSRRVYPIGVLNPYQGSWVIKVRVTNKSPLKSYRNARGEGTMFSVDFMDEEGTQIQASMFREAADKFHGIFEVGKVYYVSRGSLRPANKKYSRLDNDYEMLLNVDTQVEEASEQEQSSMRSKIPMMANFKFVPIDELGLHIGKPGLVDVIGIVQSVAETTSIRRKADNEELRKRDLVIADQSAKTVQLTIWGSLEQQMGGQLAAAAGSHPVIAVTAVKVGDYNGVSISTTSRSMVAISPDTPQAKELQNWFASDGKSATLSPAGEAAAGSRAGGRSIYAERVDMSGITDPSLGAEKAQYFNARFCVSSIKPEQAMWYNACPKCSKKIVADSPDAEGGFCESCQVHHAKFVRRYIMTVRASDSSGEAWVSIFNEQGEQMLGVTADDLAKTRRDDDKAYRDILSKATWKSWVGRLSVTQQEYMNEKRQRIAMRNVYPIDWAGESKYLLEEIAKLKTIQV